MTSLATETSTVSTFSDGLPLLEVADREQLRTWLAANHDAAAGVHLAVENKGSTSTHLTYDDAVEEALSFGWIDSTSHALDADRHTVMLVPRRPGSNWSTSNKRRVERLVAEGRMTPAGLTVVEAARADGTWTALDDVEAMIVPDDLAAALEAEAEARGGWEASSDSQRKMALYRIGAAKRPEMRSRRISEIVRAATEGRRLT